MKSLGPWAPKFADVIASAPRLPRPGDFKRGLMVTSCLLPPQTLADFLGISTTPLDRAAQLLRAHGYAVPEGKPAPDYSKKEVE